MKKWESLSIRVKLTSAFLFTLLILFFINLFLYLNVNSMLERVNEVYQSNSSLNELSETLERVQNSMDGVPERKKHGYPGGLLPELPGAEPAAAGAERRDLRQ